MRTALYTDNEFINKTKKEEKNTLVFKFNTRHFTATLMMRNPCLNPAVGKTTPKSHEPKTVYTLNS